MSNREHLRNLPSLAALPDGARLPSRRHILRALAGLGLGLGFAGQAVHGEARKKKRKKTRIRRNFFGCVDVGARCENSGQCCSGICTGKKGKKICEAHGQSTCQAGHNACVAPPTATCVTEAGGQGICGTTTGNAAYCALVGNCGPCSRDADCVPFYGEGAACGYCAECFPFGGTICMGNVAA